MNLSPSFDLDYLLDLDNEEELYNQVSNQFDEISRDFYARANLEMLHHLSVAQNAKVLELACGTGYISHELAKKAPNGQVTGIDLSTLMIKTAHEGAKKQNLSNTHFIEGNIKTVLPEFKEHSFDIAVSCFAISYLGLDYVLDQFKRLLKPETSCIGLTSSSAQSLSEWMPLFLRFLAEHTESIESFQIGALPDIPLDARDMKDRIEKAGFKNAEVSTIRIPLTFKDSQEAVSFLVSSGYQSNYFFRVKDKKTRRQLLEWWLEKIEAHYQDAPHISTTLEFLAAWNVPSR